MNCPKCGKVMLDIRAQKQNPKAPDFQCPDANCLNDKGYRTGAWLPKQKAGPAPFQQTHAAPPAAAVVGAPSPRDTYLIELYWDSFDRVLAGLKSRSLSAGFNDQQIAACVATLYIQRARG
jgi:hypothetical protein